MYPALANRVRSTDGYAITCAATFIGLIYAYQIVRVVCFWFTGRCCAAKWFQIRATARRNIELREAFRYPANHERLLVCDWQRRTTSHRILRVQKCIY